MTIGSVVASAIYFPLAFIRKRLHLRQRLSFDELLRLSAPHIADGIEVAELEQRPELCAAPVVTS
jgi:hypothetical protein